MSLLRSNGNQRKPRHQAPRSIRAFTLVEIALCLAIIGFAAVAIIGVLPAGMQVQKENREDTIINQDGMFLLEAIRGGAAGMEELMHYVDAIIVSNTVYRADFSTIIDRGRLYFTNDVKAALGSRLTNSSQIVSLLTTPKIQILPNGSVVSNTVHAYVRSITGVASDKSVANSNVREFAFRYLVRPELIPFVGPTNYLQFYPTNSSEWVRPADLRQGLYHLRLSLAWPVYEQGNRVEIGPNRRIFRTLLAGSIVENPLSVNDNVFQPNRYVTR